MDTFSHKSLEELVALVRQQQDILAQQAERNALLLQQIAELKHSRNPLPRLPETLLPQP